MEHGRSLRKGWLTVEHYRAALRHRTHEAGLFFQLPDRSLLCRFAGIYEARGDFNDNLVDGRAELFL
jgi:hypothetical protein